MLFKSGGVNGITGPDSGAPTPQSPVGLTLRGWEPGPGAFGLGLSPGLPAASLTLCFLICEPGTVPPISLEVK